MKLSSKKWISPRVEFSSNLADSVDTSLSPCSASSKYISAVVGCVESSKEIPKIRVDSFNPVLLFPAFTRDECQIMFYCGFYQAPQNNRIRTRWMREKGWTENIIARNQLISHPDGRVLEYLIIDSSKYSKMCGKNRWIKFDILSWKFSEMHEIPA